MARILAFMIPEIAESSPRVTCRPSTQTGGQSCLPNQATRTSSRLSIRLDLVRTSPVGPAVAGCSAMLCDALRNWGEAQKAFLGSARRPLRVCRQMASHIQVPRGRWGARTSHRLWRGLTGVNIHIVYCYINLHHAVSATTHTCYVYTRKYIQYIQYYVYDIRKYIYNIFINTYVYVTHVRIQQYTHAHTHNVTQMTHINTW